MIAIYKNDLINVLRRFKSELEDGYFVPAEEGKGLSSNDYTDADKQKLTSLPAANEIVTKVSGKDLSTNDYTDADKAKVTTIPADFDVNDYVEKETGKGLSTNDFTNTYKNAIDSMPAPSSIALLDANSKIPVANLPPEFTALETVATYSDLPATNLFDGRRVMVLDASGDSTVSSGFAVYVYSTTNQAWRKILEGESMDVSAIVDWLNIQNKPSDLLHETDIVDGLTSTSTTDALSANQGKVLNDKLTDGSSGDLNIHDCAVNNAMILPVLTSSMTPNNKLANSVNGAFIGFDNTSKKVRVKYNTGSQNSYSTEEVVTTSYLTQNPTVKLASQSSQNGNIKFTSSNNVDYDVPVTGLQSGAYQKIEVVSALPASPDSDTIYLVLE